MYRSNFSQGNGTAQSAAWNQAAGSGGLCGPSAQPDSGEASVSRDVTAWKNSMPTDRNSGENWIYTPVGAQSSGNVPGSLPNTPDPLNPAAPASLALPSIAPHPDPATAVRNMIARYQPQPTQGNGAAQSAGIGAIAKGLCA